MLRYAAKRFSTVAHSFHRFTTDDTRLLFDRPPNYLERNNQYLKLKNGSYPREFFEIVRGAASYVVEVCVAEEDHGFNVGSGVLVNEDGIVLTAFDLVAKAWCFKNQWDPKGKILLTSVFGEKFASNIVAADKNSGIAVLKIEPGRKFFTAARTGKSSTIVEGNPLVNVEWPSVEPSSQHVSFSGTSSDMIQMRCGRFVDFLPTYLARFGGAILTYDEELVGISQKKFPKHDGKNFASTIESGMKLVEQLGK